MSETQVSGVQESLEGIEGRVRYDPMKVMDLQRDRVATMRGVTARYDIKSMQSNDNTRVLSRRFTVDLARAYTSDYRRRCVYIQVNTRAH